MTMTKKDIAQIYNALGKLNAAACVAGFEDYESQLINDSVKEIGEVIDKLILQEEGTRPMPGDMKEVT